MSTQRKILNNEQKSNENTFNVLNYIDALEILEAAALVCVCVCVCAQRRRVVREMRR